LIDNIYLVDAENIFEKINETRFIQNMAMKYLVHEHCVHKI